MSKQWINSKGKYYYNDIPVVTDKLPKGIYELNFDAFAKEFFLDFISEDFELPEKIYGVERGLVERITTTYNRLDKNFGVLLKGLKGTGKTVVAKQVSNKLGLPVILVNKSYGDMGQFINSIDQDVIMFFDEFEKTYELSAYHNDDEGYEEKPGKKSVNQLLTLMDGVFTSKHKRLFLLTTNKVYLPDAMISRPSRIRYVKEFGDLAYEHIVEILEDSVEDKKLIPDLVDILKELQCITVDIVRSVAEEANIYGTASKEFFEIFNISRDDNKLDLYEIIKDEELLVSEDITINFDHYYVGSNLQLKKLKVFGIVEDIDYDDRKISVKENKTNKIRTFVLKKGQHIHHSMTKWTM
jgi:SpoVK/Ycf46/Vps4 family AAA+-type ATPase